MQTTFAILISWMVIVYSGLVVRAWASVNARRYCMDDLLIHAAILWPLSCFGAALAWSWAVSP